MAQSQNQPQKSNTQSDSKVSDHNSNGSAAYGIFLSKAAETAYANFYKKAAEARERGELTSAHYTALNMIDEALEEIIPRDPFNKRYALQGALSGIFRLQKGRLRICWIGSSTLRRVGVIFISETLRKAGDANDPYRILTGMVMSGQFGEIYESLGLKPPVLSHLKRQGFLAN